MSNFKIAITAFSLNLAFMFCGSANAIIIDFEGGSKPAGFSYSQFYNLQGSTYFTQDTGYVRGQTTTGGDWVGFTYGTSAQISAGTAFDFYGAYITAAWTNSLNVTLSGYNGTSLLYTQNFTINDDAPIWTDSDFFGITKLTVSSSGGIDAGTPGAGQHVAWDDIYINEDMATVPEPTTLTLMGLGLAGIAGWRRRKTE